MRHDGGAADDGSSSERRGKEFKILLIHLDCVDPENKCHMDYISSGMFKCVLRALNTGRAVLYGAAGEFLCAEQFKRMDA